MNSYTTMEARGYVPVNGLKMYYEIEELAIRWFASLPPSDTPA
jgi:hypothetical protein